MATVVVTGANRGIGFELCRLYRQRSDDVVAACRVASPELEGLGARIIDDVDVATTAGVSRLATALGNQPVDVLINNAGILRRDDFNTLDFDAMLEQYRINALAPLRVTRTVIGNLHDGSKVAIVTSRVGSLEDNSSGNNYGYRMSKAAANMVGINLHHDLSPRGIAVTMLHPGLVGTAMTGGNGIRPEEAARGLIARIDELDLDTSGGFWHAEGYPLPW